MTEVTMIYPPSGWKYDFPRELPDGVKDINLWLIENGYPRQIIKYWEESSFGNVPYKAWIEERD